MSTQYSAVVSELYSAIVFQRNFKEIASLVLKGTTIKFDTVEVMNDVTALAIKIEEQAPPVESQELKRRFNSGALMFHVEFSTRDPKMYAAMGMSRYFTEKTVQAYALKQAS